MNSFELEHREAELEPSAEDWSSKLEKIELGLCSPEELFNFLREPHLAVKIAAIEALSRAEPDPRLVNELRKLLGDPEWEVKWAALRTLGALLGEPLLQKMGSPLGEERKKALLSAIKNRRRDLAFAIYSLLDDERDCVVKTALEAIAFLGLEEGVEKAIEFYSSFSPELKSQVYLFFKEELLRRNLFIEGELPRCSVCEHPLSGDNLFRAGTWSGSYRYFCRFHFEEFCEAEKPFEGKFYRCKVCDGYWPKYQIVDQSCPICREQRFSELLSARRESQILCFLCQKTRREGELFPIKFRALSSRRELEWGPSVEGQRICFHCAEKLATEKVDEPYFSERGIYFLSSLEGEGFFFCDECRGFYPLSERFSGSDFRDFSICKNCAEKRKK